MKLKGLFLHVLAPLGESAFHHYSTPLLHGATSAPLRLEKAIAKDLVDHGPHVSILQAAIVPQ